MAQNEASHSDDRLLGARKKNVQPNGAIQLGVISPGDVSPTLAAPSAEARRRAFFAQAPFPSSALAESILASSQPHPDDNFFGLQNFGNTCYCASVLQALYFCRPLRYRLTRGDAGVVQPAEPSSTPTSQANTLNRAITVDESKSNTLPAKTKRKKGSVDETVVTASSAPQPDSEGLLSCLRELFEQINSQKKRVGCLSPKRIVHRIKRSNEQFDNAQQHDAHEFFMFLINHINDELKVLQQKSAHPSVNGSGQGSLSSNMPSPIVNNQSTPDTWLQDLFEGVVVSETKCLNCETSSFKEEAFLVLSVDIQPNMSVGACLKQFSSVERLTGEQKYHCDVCACKQEADRWQRIAKQPKMLVLHLKRFKLSTEGAQQRFVKLNHRIVFGEELRMSGDALMKWPRATADNDGTTPPKDDSMPRQPVYDLCSIVIHSGQGPYRGHYTTVARSGDLWLLFDDDSVDRIDAAGGAFDDYYGLVSDSPRLSADVAYLLFYEMRDNSAADL